MPIRLPDWSTNSGQRPHDPVSGDDVRRITALQRADDLYWNRFGSHGIVTDAAGTDQS